MEPNRHGDIEWWYEGEAHWKKMPQHYADLNEAAFQAKHTFLFYQVPFGNATSCYNYEIDLEGMSQRNVDTNKVRSLQRWMRPGSGAQVPKEIAVWEFLSDQGW